MNPPTAYTVPERPGFIRRCVGLALFMGILAAAYSGALALIVRLALRTCSNLLSGL